MKSNQTVAVLGASQKPDRYSNRAVRMLKEHGHHVIPVHPKLETIENFPVVHELKDIQEPVDTLSLYVSPDRVDALIDQIVALKPGRVIFNPGTESKTAQERLTKAGIPFVQGCTLVMLQTAQF